MRGAPSTSSIPRFETKRLILKGVSLEDATSYEKHFVDYEVVRHLSAVVPWPYPENGIVEFLKTRIQPELGTDHWIWGIFLKENPSELIGAIELWRDGKPEHRGFWLGRRFWGQGLMTEAVEPVMDFAFHDLGFKKLVFANAVGNLRSRRVKEKTGARLVRVERARFVDPTLREHEIWELSKKDWDRFKMGPSLY